MIAVRGNPTTAVAPAREIELAFVTLYWSHEHRIGKFIDLSNSTLIEILCAKNLNTTRD